MLICKNLLKVGVDSTNLLNVAVPAEKGRVSSTVRCQMQHQTIVEVWSNVQCEAAPVGEVITEKVQDGHYKEYGERKRNWQGERITLKIRIKVGKKKSS